jgi:hypothetical protein
LPPRSGRQTLDTTAASENDNPSDQGRTTVAT